MAENILMIQLTSIESFLVAVGATWVITRTPALSVFVPGLSNHKVEMAPTSVTICIKVTRTMTSNVQYNEEGDRIDERWTILRVR